KDVDEIVLVSGSTQIPKIHQILMDLFRGKRPSQGINLDEAVVIGAAISGGIKTVGGVFTPFIHWNSPVPTSHTKILSTLEDNQSTVVIQVYKGIPSTAHGAVQLEVKFELDANGILFGEHQVDHNLQLHFGIDSEDDFGSNDGSETYKILEDESTPSDIHTKSTLEGMDNSMMRLEEEESESRLVLILSIEQAAILHAKKMHHLEGLVMSLEECLRDRRHIDPIINMGRNLMAIEVTVHEIQFWKAEHSFMASLAEIDNVIHTLAKLD
ncbi:hypothetical protein FRC11_013648, partial [Ceratobasidium sp. 423]